METAVKEYFGGVKAPIARFALFAIMFVGAFSASAQQAVPRVPPAPTVPATDTLAQTDSTTVQPESNSIAAKEQRLGIKISPDAPEHEVNSSARDSAVIDLSTNTFYLYGDAKVDQADMKLAAGIVEFDQKENIVRAFPLYDTAGKKISEQSFTQGEETFYYDSLRYNFKSRRALVRNARMQYGDAYINSYQVKRNPDQSIFGYRNLYTTCNLDHPHFGISANKIKVIPNKIAASGPAHLQIADLPTPLVFPFGIFPINPQQKSGFILPTYTMEANRGIGLQRLGYYFSINDYIGLSTTFDVFSQGSYSIYASTEYNVRYRYSGAFNFDYTYTEFGDEFDMNKAGRQTNFKVRWRHAADSRAMPGASFAANVDFGTGNYNRLNGMTADVQLNNTYNSSISYSKSWQGRPFMFTAAARHNQSTQTGLVSVTLPDIAFNVSQLTPFQQKNRVGKQRWYEKISATYNLAVQNRLDFVDSTFSLQSLNFKDFTNGIRHTANVSATYNIFRFVRWNFSVPYTEYWNTRQEFRTWNYDKYADDTTVQHGFYASRHFSISSGFNTRIYGMKMFKKGKIMGIRHVITPTLSFNFTPGFANAPFNYFHNYYDRYGDLQYQSYYQSSPIGGPGNPQPDGSVRISINNNLQMKVRSGDSTGSKNITILDGFDISTSYNMIADSNNLRNITFSGRTSILNQFNISFGGSFDPYYYEGRVRTRHYLAAMDGPLAVMRNFNLSLDFSLNGNAQADPAIEALREENEQVAMMLRNNGLNQYYDFNIPWNLMVRGSYDYRRVAQDGKADTIYHTPNLTVGGSLRFTPKMMFNFFTGYDFVQKNVSTTTFNLTRDLHCWQMMLNISPFGLYRNYNFTLNVKSSVLQDLKLTRKKAPYDNF